MSRVPVITRSATRADVPSLVRLYSELREVGGRAERALNPAVTADVETRLIELIADPATFIAVATVAGETIGMAIAQRGPVAPLSDVEAVHLHHLVVSDGQRHRGVGQALVGAAAAYAEDAGVEHVVAHAYPSMREANRFYARLGFAPVVVRRVAPVAVLRRRLAATERMGTRLDLVRRRAMRRPSVAAPRRALEGVAELPAER